MSSEAETGPEPDGWARSQTVLARTLPFALLAVGTAITVLQAQWDATVDLALALVLTAVSAVWLALTVVVGTRPWNAWAVSIAFTGLVLLSGALVVVAPWYGIFAFVGYLQAFEWLRGGWRYVGVVAVSMIMSITYMGGIDRISRDEWWLWATVALVGTGLASLCFSGVDAFDRQAVRQRRVVAELHEANARLSAALEENTSLHERLVAGAREAGMLDERQRMAREIHDTLAQGLAGILTQLEAAELHGEAERHASRHLRTARELARESLAEARRTVHAVQPGALAEARLPEALGTVGARWAEVNGTDAEVRVTGDPQPLDAEVEGALLRIAQECLANIARHADAGRVGITLSYMPDLVALDVRDDGVGFEPSHLSVHGRGFGLIGMRQRVERVGGTLILESERGAGTVVSVSVPVAKEGTR